MDDQRLRAILRSVIILSAATPAGVMFACGAVAPDAGPVDDGDAATTTAPDAAMTVGETGVTPIADASLPDVLRFPPSDRCMTYGPLPEGGAYGTQTKYEAGVCAESCEPPSAFDAATPATACWALHDPTFGDILGCAYPNGDPSLCGCAATTRQDLGEEVHVAEPLPCRGVPEASTIDEPACIHLCTDGRDLATCPGVTRCFTGVPASPGQLTCVYCFTTIGRRAAGVIEAPPARGAPIGAFLADARHREAASVRAFARMREELVAHGAPRDLVVRTERAREDEIRHAAIMAALARRFGAEEGEWAEEPRFDHVGERSLEEIARENAVEGCVYETWSALMNFWQAENAHDAVLRKALASIAEDELRHASLAWSVHEWIVTELEPAARARVEAAKRDAASGLRVPPNELARELIDDAGLPDCAASRRLVSAMDAALWSAAA